MVFPPGRPGHSKKLRFSSVFAFAKLDTRNKETLASRLAYGSADPSRHLEKAPAFPRCLAFAKLDTRNKEALTSKLAAPPYYSCLAWTQCSSMFSIKIPYPFVESWMNTWVTAPMRWLAVLNDGTAAHALYDAAGEFQKLFVHDADHHPLIFLKTRVIHFLNFDLIISHLPRYVAADKA